MFKDFDSFAEAVGKICDQVEKAAIRITLTIVLLIALWGFVRGHVVEAHPPSTPEIRQSLPHHRQVPPHLLLRLDSG